MPFSQISIASAPRLLWDTYLEYLWNYQPGSWVGRTASSFRILALLLVLPVVILTLLDVTSYVIARTLGIVDDVKASTSDNNIDELTQPVPTVLVQDTSTPQSLSEDATPEEAQRRCSAAHVVDNLTSHTADDIKPQAFFAGEGDLQLSGVGVFSPAASQPSSPVLSRKKFSTVESGIIGAGDVDVGTRDDGIFLRRRPQGTAPYETSSK
ncbi:hypothetical protein F5I97DRAFT_706719 [Phlebopus sp. FC_14]|nr:hypothetical protein F5I97DRAFT_706719 [Phlebopus sp. FC_14]